MAPRETPMGLVLAACDMLIEDRQTGKKSLIGLFDKLFAANFPCTHPAMTVMVALTSGHGDYPCELVCRHSDSETVAFSAKGKISFRDPSQVVDLVFQLRQVRFPKSGTYWLHFLVDGVPVLMRPLFIQPAETSGDKTGKDKGKTPPPADS